MTGDEIIKALGIHASDNMREDCEKCPYNSLDYCSECLCEDVLNLIARQQAEIERLNVELVGMRGACESYKMYYDAALKKIKVLEYELDEMNELVKLAPKYGQEE